MKHSIKINLTLICLFSITTNLIIFSTLSNANLFSLRCEEWPRTDLVEELDDNCKILKLFNRSEVEQMEVDESVRLARYCACQLALMDHIFEEQFDRDDTTRQLYKMVTGKLQHDHELAQMDHQQHVGRHFSTRQQQTITRTDADNNHNNNNRNRPRISSSSTSTRFDQTQRHANRNNASYLWNDVDVTLYGISIYTSTKDYVEKVSLPKFKMDPELKSQIFKDRVFRIIRAVCAKVAKDDKLMYQYLENLARFNPIVFLELTNMNEQIGFIYQASKACKLLLLEHITDYKLRPSSPDFVPVAGYPINFDKQIILAQKQQQLQFADINNDNNNEPLNEISMAGGHNNQVGSAPRTWDSMRNDVDLQLQKSSPAMVFGCKKHKRLDMKSLETLCPMMFEERISADWFKEHSQASDRSMLALNCGCQLILHNSTWSTIMQDPNVQQMSKCLTMYLNQNTVPNFMTTPITTLYGWFTEIMHKFSTNRLFTIRQMFDSSFEDGDPLKPINHSDDVKSLEILRRGCNLIMFNYNRNSRFTSELKLIKYLDRLQLLSQDNLFVFHLTLMDPNLFKLHALSKMCEPIIS